MAFKEHNNREIAKKMAEYITGEKLRRYTAEKVKKYLGESPVTVFDGAIGSGQLEQYVNVEKIYGVEIQEKSYLTALENFPTADIENKSFFDYERENLEVDCVIMNPPFSIKFNELSDNEKLNIQKDFDWKKSGLVDDIFVLKSLKYAKRYGFYILFPGLTYRQQEKKFRELIGGNLAELNIVHNAFTDTTVSVIFIVIDKEKETDEYFREVVDFKTNNRIQVENGVLDSDFRWEQPVEEKEVEIIDIDEVNRNLQQSALIQIETRLKLDILLNNEFEAGIDVLGFIKKLRCLCDKYEKESRRKKKCKTKLETLEKMTQYSKQLSLFSQ